MTQIFYFAKTIRFVSRGRKFPPFLFTLCFEDFSAPAQPFLLQQANNLINHNFLPQQNTTFFFLSELMDLFVAGRDQSAANQPNNLPG
jgi:hypothetical protein